MLNWLAKHRGLFLWFLAFALAGSTGLGAEQGLRESAGLKFPEYYDAPHEKQMKSLLEGPRSNRNPMGVTFAPRSDSNFSGKRRDSDGGHRSGMPVLIRACTRSVARTPGNAHGRWEVFHCPEKASCCSKRIRT